MIKILKNVQKQLFLAQKARFCNIPNQNQDDNSQGGQQGSKEVKGQAFQQNKQSQSSGESKDQHSQKKHFQPRQNQDAKGNNQQHQNQQQQTQQQNNIYGSKVNAGNKEEIKKSIQKSVQDFSAQFKLGLNEKKQKVGNPSTFTKKESLQPIKEKKQKLLNQIKPTEEKLMDKNIGNVPIAQQIVVDRLKKYGLRTSDTRRVRDHLKEEEGVDFAYVEPRNLDILNSHIHKQSEEMEELITSYLGVNQTLGREDQLEEWRKQQALDHMNFTPETMGKPEAFYPGSELGPHPLDDPLNYVQWYKKHCPTPYLPVIEQMTQLAEIKITDSKMPRFLKKWVKQVIEEPQDYLEEEKNKDLQEDDKDTDEEDTGSEDEDTYLGESRVQSDELEQQLTSAVGGGQGIFFYKSGPLPRIQADNSTLWYLNQIDELSEEISPEEQIANSEGNITFHSGLQDYEIPPLPENMTENVSHYQIPIIDKWSVFRQFPNMYHWWKNFYETTKTYHEQPLHKYQYRGLPSVYTYFHTLPEFARNNLVVQNVARCFEFRRHEITVDQKMMALNFAAKFSLPLDDLITHAASQMIVSQRHFLTAKEEDKLRSVNSFYYEADPDAWAIHLAQEEHTIEQIENFQPPKYLGVNEVEEPLCDLPLEFYDNQDGFWDEFIREKYNRNHREYPTTRSRPFFKH